MTGLMIITLVVALVACGAVFVIVDVLAGGIIKQMKKEVFRYVKQYNEHMQAGTAVQGEKKVQANSVMEGIKMKEETLPVPFLPSVRPMRKQDFFQDYRKLRELFDNDMGKVIQQIPQKTQEETTAYVLYAGMLERLNFDTLYEISSLTSENQLEVLREVFKKAECEVREQYLAETEQEFDCTQFHTYLKSKKAECDDTIYCYVGRGSKAVQSADAKLELSVDEELCEGFQLLHGNLLYDYGVRSSELM